MLSSTVNSCVRTYPVKKEVVGRVAVSPSPQTKTNGTLEGIGLSASAMDKSVAPCDDFFQYSCGGWLERTKIPAEESRWSRSFSEINKRLELQLKTILEDLVTTNNKNQDDSAQEQNNIAKLYQRCIDTEALDRSKPMGTLNEKMFQVIDSMKSVADLAGVFGLLHRMGVNAGFSIAPEQDFSDATKMIAEFDQSGLGLPDREYYLSEDKKKADIREFYQRHIAEMFELSAINAVTDAASAVFAIESSLAKAAQDRVTRRKPDAVYHPHPPKVLAEYMPDFNWTAYFDALGLPNLMRASRINFTSETYFRELSKLIADTSITKWKAYLKWHVIHAFGDHLNGPVRISHFKLRQKLTGQKKNRERWKRCISLVNSVMGDVLGREFVAKHFAKESKDAVTSMIHGIRQAFAENLAGLTWIDDKTRLIAAKKAKQMEFLVGYPGKWRRYPFQIADSHISNVIAGRQNEVAYDLAKIGSPVDRTLWIMSPSTVNAYYNPPMNHMVFPAGILQPPFYNNQSAFAVNMGSLGMIVGHELTHGFDDQGSKFDGDGNMKGWWSPSIRSRFEKKTQCIEKQYSQFDALPNTKLNGSLTLGENIADAGGLKLSFDAYRARIKEDSSLDRGTVEGHTSDQQFFVAAAQAWCAKYRSAYAAMLVEVDPHSPPKFRVNGTLSNMPEFSAAFSCTEKAPMVNTPQCAVW